MIKTDGTRLLCCGEVMLRLDGTMEWWRRCQWQRDLRVGDSEPSTCQDDLKRTKWNIRHHAWPTRHRLSELGLDGRGRCHLVTGF
jgi:hypothetical protein